MPMPITEPTTRKSQASKDQRADRLTGITLSLATRLLVFTAKSVAKGLKGIFKLAFRIPSLFVRSVKEPVRKRISER